MRGRLEELVYSLQRYYPLKFESLMREIENGHRDRARQILREMGTFVEEGYHDALLQHLTGTVTNASISTRSALWENPDALRILIRSGNKSEAIELYHERTGEDWKACLDFINALEKKLEAETASALEARAAGADPAVLFFLVKAGHLEDAARYFSQQTASAIETARAVLVAMQQDIESGRLKLPEPVRRTPDLDTVRFLLRAGHEMIAIRYYRDCTAAGIVEAKQIIAGLREA